MPKNEEKAAYIRKLVKNRLKKRKVSDPKWNHFRSACDVSCKLTSQSQIVGYHKKDTPLPKYKKITFSETPPPQISFFVHLEKILVPPAKFFFGDPKK